MLENEIYTALVALINAGAANLNVPAFKAKQRFQPTAQGIDSGPTAYVTVLFHTPVGSPERKSVPVVGQPLKVALQETQLYETTAQVTGVYAQDQDGPELTAADIANYAQAILRSEWGMGEMLAAGMALLRVGQVRAVQFQNGSDEWETAPVFDFVFTHNQVTVSQAPAVSATALRTVPV